jgi:hypothetical protein
MTAIRVHADQRDKRGEPYLLHVLRVVEAVSDEAKVVAALHDCLEDGGAPAFNLIARLGLDQEARDTLSDLTRGEESYGDYIERIDTSGNEIAREVKLADLRDNLGRIPAGPCRADGGGEGSMEAYEPDWRSLKARYEKAIDTLESAQ